MAASDFTSPVLRSSKNPATFVLPMSTAKPKNVSLVSPGSTAIISRSFHTTAVAVHILSSVFAPLIALGSCQPASIESTKSLRPYFFSSSFSILSSSEIRSWRVALGTSK